VLLSRRFRVCTPRKGTKTQSRCKDPPGDGNQPGLKFWSTYRLRLQRKKYLLRAYRKGAELQVHSDRTDQIKPGALLAFVTQRNEQMRLPYFLKYYRDLGIDHFLFVDNGSEDGSTAYLAAQPDVSVWTTQASYRRARFGMDWINHLLRRYGSGHWCLTVDPDEFLVYPFCEARPLRAMTDWMDASQLSGLSAMLLDMYPRGPVQKQTYTEGQNPLEVTCWFDGGNYTTRRNPQLHNLWIQGGPRARKFFADTPKAAPALNKIPLVKWQSHFAYVESTHMLLPRGNNKVYSTDGGERISGCLLHAKFLPVLAHKSQEELSRRQHYAKGREYAAYHALLQEDEELVLWHEFSERYISWRQLEILGLMSKGTWA